ncbi:hypothetical protein CDV55_102906 [Aspergillus turcosus]|uniref:Aminoglycoside phosphotransferase domain-containing protein n=1 Tax=Aspergillus turcosus TaxID=1245748 RepID=A0A229YT34_9EURO|nr:hypothetical protein CDV55_102906 [Aspergillus turcosus]RLL97874.1 hypothetical protein CFD26_106398 [Aspergillus turcosus]
MPKTRQLLRGKITYSDAKAEESNILHQLGYHSEQTRFFARLRDRREWMKAAVTHHLGLRSSDECHVADTENWLHGSFNVCVPVTIDSWGKRVLLRFPLPYRVGESFRPGNCDEKIRCEAGSYAWLQKNCPDVPIPKLYGFGLSTGETFTRLEFLPFFHRCFQLLRQYFLLWLKDSVPSNYVRHQSPDPIVDNGYLLIEFIEETRGSMLSNTWMEGRHDPKLRTNFFRDLSRLFLNITRIPLPKIGSFMIDNDGFLHLINRPLSIEIPQLENEKIPTEIPRNYTYSTVDSYVVDILGFHDNRFRYQPNAVNNLGDCAYQLSVLTAMRTIFPSILNRGFRRGPFVFAFTDLHQSNIFVDAEWHITCLVDLEWTCSQPVQMVGPPYWLTNKGVDQLDATEYDSIRQEFMEALTTEEQALTHSDCGTSQLHLSDFMKRSWETGAFWYSLALSSPSGLFTIFSKHIRPLFCKDYEEEFQVVMPFFFEKNVGYIAGRKLADREEYDKNLRQAFEDDSEAFEDNSA